MTDTSTEADASTLDQTHADGQAKAGKAIPPKPTDQRNHTGIRGVGQAKATAAPDFRFEPGETGADQPLAAFDQQTAATEDAGAGDGFTWSDRQGHRGRVIGITRTLSDGATESREETLPGHANEADVLACRARLLRRFGT